MEESLEGLRKELEAVENEENKLRAQEVDIKHEVEKYETVLKENQQKVKHWQKEVYNAACEQALHLGELRVVTRERGKKPPPLVASPLATLAKNGDPARRLYNEGSNPYFFCKQRKTSAREVWLWKLLTIKDENNGAAVYVYILSLLLIITFTILEKKLN